MKDPDIEKFLENVQAPAPDAGARLRAKQAALAAFERAQRSNNILDLPRQESGGDARLSREHNSRGSTAMKKFANRGWYAAAAGLGVVALGLTWVLPNLDRYTQELAATDVAATATTGAAELPAQAPEHAPEPVAPEHEIAGSPAAGAARGASVPETAEATGRADDATQAENSSSPASISGSVAALEPQRQQAVADARRAAQARTERENEVRLASQMQMSPPAPPPPMAAKAAGADSRTVTVTGIRPALSTAHEVKREALGVVDAIVSEDIGAPPYHDDGRDKFEHFDLNPVRQVAQEPVSTFSVDVDTASYSFVRAQLNAGELPEKDAVRVEEMINYFDYAWPAAASRSAPFKPTVVVGDSPWSKHKKLVHIGIKGYEVDRGKAPDANLVLLLDVSGSMNEPNKLPLVVRSMELLLGSLKPTDTVGIVVYAGAAGAVLEPTPVRDKEKIVAALRSLRPGGSTAGAAGIELAYRFAEQHFRKGGVNRILLATDGDFNVGVNGTEALKGMVERWRAKGVYLSVLGFGQGNYRDELAQALAQNGNGVAAYIDTENEARKVLVQEASASLFTIAQDVKLQVEFNPAAVSEYRLVGYETRALEREDFNNDAVDAGDVGAGHTVTAIYEITPVGAPASVDELRYAENRPQNRTGDRRDVPHDVPRGQTEYGFLKIRYKLPGEKASKLITEPILQRPANVSAAVKRDVTFSTAVAGFAQLLRGGQYTGALTYDDVIEAAQSARGEDRFGYRAEFIDLVRRAREARD
jgi:Ca-activated chloride channel family protein